ncbi:Putative agmatinase 1 [Penicillium digitatum PHI26]|nr:Putative agmatinase 1 [Penicillium digitatum Pd1]EKV12633.1 Putative agmatinase 1 [Penicillium digitatum PHI26]EKV15211.1 Putative agmatinase 1 [Penicillium digitatum Pd1]
MEGLLKNDANIHAGIRTKLSGSSDYDNDGYCGLETPATGTPETGGWSTRELRAIIHGLDGLNFMDADIVEVAPANDPHVELSTMAAAAILHEVLTLS